MKDIWKQLCKNTDGIIFVVDSTERNGIEDADEGL